MGASPLRGRSGRQILAVLILILLVHAPAHASAASGSPSDDLGGIGVRLLDKPADAGEDPRALLYIVDHLAPGSVISRSIEVTNTTSESAAVSMYAAAAGIEDGHFVVADGHTPNDLTTWSTVLPAMKDLRAGGAVTVTVTINVPPDAAAGERYGVVWAEVRSSAASGIVQVNRVGIRLYVSVGPGAPPAANFTIDSLTAQRSPGGLPTVLATVHNTGGRALDLAGSLELLNGPGGLSAGPFPVSPGFTLAIGASGQVTIALDERVPDGPWDATLTLHSGLLERSASASIIFPDSGSALPVPATPVEGGRTPAAIGLVVALLLCCLVLLFMFWQRRHHA
jgi:hypothetical protein